MQANDEGDIQDDEDATREFMARLKASPAAFERFKRSIDDAVAELNETGGTPLDFEEIKRKGRELMAARRRQQQ